MSFKDWLFTNYPGASKVQPWGILHIVTLILCISAIVAIAFLFKNKNKKTKKIVLWVLVGIILFFEIARRVVNLVKTTDYSFTNIMGTLLPRPWCAISCWSLIIAAIFRKRFLFNFASISALLCAIIFFAYPGVGFKSPYLLFDDLYSIFTHAFLLVTSISLMTLGFTEFRYKKFWKVALCFVVIFAYAFLEIYVLKIEADPLYFMPGNDVMDILGVGHLLYVVIYSVFMLLFVNLFFIINEAKRKHTKTKNLKN